MNRATFALSGAIGLLVLPEVFALTLPTLPASPNIPNRTYSVSSYGAKGDGTTDDAMAIQSAVNALSAAGGGTLEFGAATYEIYNPDTSGSSSALPIISIPSSIRLQGSTRGTTVIQLAASQGAYASLIGARNTTANDVDVENITFDNNGPNNPVAASGTFGNYPRMALRFSTGARFRVAYCVFTNQNNVNTVSFNGGASSSDVEVCSSTFENVGGGSVDHDHSSIYTHCVRAWIHDNTFSSRSGPGTIAARTAIEIHGDDQTVSRNTIDGYAYGMNVSGDAQSSNRQVYENNAMTHVFGGMEIWSDYIDGNTTNPALQNCTIQNNQISLTVAAWRSAGLPTISSITPSAGIFLEPNGDAPIDGLAILNNVITFPVMNSNASGDVYSAGILLWKASHATIPISALTISGNQVANALSAAVWSNALITGTEGSQITSNVFTNPGRTQDALSAQMRSGIYITGMSASLIVENNTTTDSASTPLIRYGAATVSTCTFACSVGSKSVQPASVTSITIGPGWNVGSINPCDLNGDGQVNVADVQWAVNQAVGIVPCTNANLQGTSPPTCNTIDVRRIVNAALGGQCVTGP